MHRYGFPTWSNVFVFPVADNGELLPNTNVAGMTKSFSSRFPDFHFLSMVFLALRRRLQSETNKAMVQSNDSTLITEERVTLVETYKTFDFSARSHKRLTTQERKEPRKFIMLTVSTPITSVPSYPKYTTSVAPFSNQWALQSSKKRSAQLS